MSPIDLSWMAPQPVWKTRAPDHVINLCYLCYGAADDNDEPRFMFRQIIHWIIPAAMAIAVTAAFLLLIPVGDKAKDRPSSPKRDPAIHTPTNKPTASHAKQPTASPDSGIYKWVDSAGQVHYGKHPPEGANAQRIDMNSTTVSVIDMETPQTPAQLPPVTRQPETYRQPQQPASRISSHESENCQNIKNAIKRIDRRMNRGYRVQEGERLKERRRELVKARNQACH